MSDTADAALSSRPAGRETVWCSFMTPKVIAALGVEALVQAGAAIRFGPTAMLTNLLGGLAPLGLSWLVGKGLPYAIARLFGHIPGRLFALITDGVFALTWAALHLVRVKGRSLADWAKYWVTNQLDNLFAGGGKHGRECPAPRSYDPHPRTALADTFERFDNLARRSGEYDVTPLYHALLDAFRPIEIQREDDLPPITLERLLQHSVVMINGVERAEHPTMARYREVLDAVDSNPASEHHDTVRIRVEDDFARGTGDRTEYGAATVYARVVWSSDAPRQLRLFYGHLRAGSYSPTEHLYPHAFYHDGDGESVEVLVHVVNEQEGPVAYLAGIAFGGHGETLTCAGPGGTQDGQGPLAFEVHTDDLGGARPVVYVAYGSHSLSPQGGRQPGTHVTTDWYPESGETPPLAYQLAKNLTNETNNLVFTQRAMWGHHDGSYKGYKHHAFHPACGISESAP